MLYGQMPPTPGLDAFYRRPGFEIGQPGQPIDLWVIFGVHAKAFPGADERIFHRWQLPGGPPGRSSRIHQRSYGHAGEDGVLPDGRRQ